jgi:MFS family permease
VPEALDPGLEAGERRWLTPGVGGVGLASFFSDSGHEIATSVLPTFVTSTLHASAGTLGLIEGVSDALTGVAKLIAGPLANDEARRLRMASGGYVVTAAATGAIGLAATVWQAGLARAAAWLARGVRTPARDAMLASLAPPEAYGRAFGLERASDNLGAVVGPLLAAALVASLGVRHVLYLSAIPGAFAALAITLAAAEARRRHVTTRVRQRARLQVRALHEAGVVRSLLPIAAFELGNVATSLLILRAATVLHHGGRSIATATSLAVLIYAGHNLFGAIVSYAGGHWLDRTGPRRVFASGAAVYVAGYSLFALPFHSWPILVGAFLLAGSGIGFAETAESALVARLLPDDLRGSGFGVLGGVQSVGDFASSAAVGLLWTAVSPTVAFAYAAAWMCVSVVTAGFIAGTRSDDGSEGYSVSRR